MPENPTPAAAAATPAVLNDDDAQIVEIRARVAYAKTGGMSMFGVHVSTLEKLLAQLDAATARADAAEKLAAFRLDTIHDLDGALAQLRPALDAARANATESARQTRDAQASLLAAIADKEDERKRAEWAVQSYTKMVEQVKHLEGAVVAHAQALADAEAALADERARGERLVYRVANVLTGEVVAAFADATEGEAFLALPEYAERYGFIEVLAAPASPAAEPADQTAARSPGE